MYTRGLLGGKHSDITVIAFGQRYALHRLILDRAPFFTTALSEPWLESTAKEITLHPEEIDANITQTAFELALKGLYGCDTSHEEESEAVGLFATGCWLEMQGVVDSSVDAILRKMTPDSLASLIRLVTANYYGRAGERILSSAKSMLCRDGWEMPIRYWDNIPGDIVREIVGGDGFFVDGEWSRWVLAKRLLDRRLRKHGIDAGLIPPGRPTRVKAPDTLSLSAVRYNGVYRQNTLTTGRQSPEPHEAWIALYTHPEVEPLLVLLDQGIHYVHLEFEQLQYIRQARDELGLPVMPEKVITNALWMQMEIRQKVLNAQDGDLELGLSRPTQEPATVQTAKEPKGKQKADEHISRPADEDDDLGNWNGIVKPRKFWIPSADCNIVMGGNSEPVVTTSTTFQRHASRLSASLQPEDAQWATDFGSLGSNPGSLDSNRGIPARPSSASGSNAGQPHPIAFTHYPPFRFAAEFPNPRLLKEKKRVYSRTVFYAGSLWNIYIQKVRSSKNAQLGVYLHRAKERDAEEVITGTAGLSHSSVDERIGYLEREMLMRSERRLRRPLGRTTQHTIPSGEEETSGSGGEQDSTTLSTTSRRPLFGTIPRRSRRSTVGDRNCSNVFSESNAGQEHAPVSTASIFDVSSPLDVTSDDEDTEPELPDPSIASRKNARSMSTLPPYVDGRPTIKTYFKIYSPSKGGRLLSVYESAPDRFNFSQSWGWKSSTLMLDEGFLGTDSGSSDMRPGGTEGDADDPVVIASQNKKDGKLRFMVVIGNL